MAVSESVAGWSKTAADNGDVDSGIVAVEGQAPGTLNNAIRGAMAAIAKFRDDQGGDLSSGGSSNAYTLTTNQGLDTAYKDGDFLCFVANHANDGAATLNVDSIGAEPIRKVAFNSTTPNDVALEAGDIVIDQHCLVQWDASADSAGGAWILLNPTPSPAGRVTTIASGNLPAAAVLDITDIPATYRWLQLVINGASSDTATRKIQVQISQDNGSNFLSSNYGGFTDDGVDPTQLGTIIASQASTMGTGGTARMVVDFHAYQAGVHTSCTFAGDDAAGNQFSGNGVYLSNTVAMDAIRVLWSGTGNFDAGTYALKGIR